MIACTWSRPVHRLAASRMKLIVLTNVYYKEILSLDRDTAEHIECLRAKFGMS